MKTFNIGIDIDGVLADFNSAFIQRCIDITGQDLFPPRPFDIPTWNYPEYYGYLPMEVSQVWKSIKNDPTFWQKLPAYPDCREALGNLAVLDLAGHNIYFVTARPGIYAKQQTETWLWEQGFDRATVIISAEKGLCARALGLHWYLDDRWENVCDVMATPGTRTVLVTRPWNDNNWVGGRDIFRVDSGFAYTSIVLHSVFGTSPEAVV